ncbi:MAG TPA: YggT family protein [Acidimicrobiales bacterium]|nr:YggT family protein [Acidimicrobiales bacterium]
MRLLCLLIDAYLIALFARIILSWFPVSPGGAMAQIFSLLYSITEPVLGPIRRAIPPIGMGGMGFDLSPIIVIIGTRILAGLLGC